MSIIRLGLFRDESKNKFREETLIFSVLANSHIFPILLECFFPEYGVDEFPSFSSKVKFLMDDKNLKRLSYFMGNDQIGGYFIEELRGYYEQNKGLFDMLGFSDFDLDFINAIFDALRSFDEVKGINDFKEQVRQRVIDNLFRI